jgi:hypothetical protein
VALPPVFGFERGFGETLDWPISGVPCAVRNGVGCRWTLSVIKPLCSPRPLLES